MNTFMIGQVTSLKNGAKEAIADSLLYSKYKRIQTLQDLIVEEADKVDAYITKEYFGIKRRVVDESQFEKEIDELKTILQSIQFSSHLHDRFDQSREKLVSVIKEDDSGLLTEINCFEKLDLDQRMQLAEKIVATFAEIFFDFGYQYALPNMEYDPDAFTSLHTNFGLKKDSDYPIASRIRFTKRVLGEDAEKNRFLNLIFHESCVHAPMYQLEQGFYYGYLSKEKSLYEDAKQRRIKNAIRLVPAFTISSVYPNFLEESIAFKQSALFVDDLGLKQVGLEDEIILKSSDRNWPYTPPKPI